MNCQIENIFSGQIILVINFHLFLIDSSRRRKRSIRNSIWSIVKRIKRGIEKLVDTYIYHTLYKINNISTTGGSVHKTIDQIVKDMIADIDNRLNKPKKKDLGGYVCLELSVEKYLCISCITHSH